MYTSKFLNTWRIIWKLCWIIHIFKFSLACLQDALRFSFGTQCGTLIDEQIPCSFKHRSCYSLQKVFLKGHEILNPSLANFGQMSYSRSLKKENFINFRKSNDGSNTSLQNESWKILLRIADKSESLTWKLLVNSYYEKLLCRYQ